MTPEEEKKLKVFKLEFDVFRSTGIVVPSVMTDKEWLYVIQYCQGFHRRKSYYSYLFKNEMRTASLKEKAKVNIKLQKEKLAELERLQAEGHIERFRNRFMLLLLDRTANVFYYNNIFWNMVNGGQRLVFDFSYEDQMNIFELTDLTRQVRMSFKHLKLVGYFNVLVFLLEAKVLLDVLCNIVYLSTTW